MAVEQPANQPQQVYCDECGYGLDPTLEGPHCTGDKPGLHLVDGPNGSRGRYVDYKTFLSHARMGSEYRGHRPTGMSHRSRKRAMKVLLRRVNRAIRRRAARERGVLVCAGPSEKAVARGQNH